MASSHLSPRTLRRLFALLLAICLAAGLGLGARTTWAAGVPQALLSVPATGFIGEPLTLTVSFDNTSAADTGYGPYIDLVLPAAGADGAGAATDDGISFLSATYLGTPVAPLASFICAGSYTHPLTNLTTSCTAGTQIVVLQPPYGSFTATQPPAPIVVSAALSNLADVGTPLTVQARAGFFLGNDPLDNPATDAPIVQGSATSASFTPVLWTLTKTYIGPEDETATGPNFPRKYRIDIDIADGQPITNLEISDILPPSMQFISVDAVTAAVGSPTVTSIATPGTTAPGGTLTRRLSSATGTAGKQDASLLFSFFVPRLNAASAPILPAATGDDALGVNDARSAGSWDPIDDRDPIAAVTSDLTVNDHTLEEQSIAIQKDATNVTDSVNTPDDRIVYTLDLQVSDYFAFQDVIATDKLGDGLRFDDTYTPTLACTEHGVTTNGAFAVANYTVSDNWSDLNGATAPNPGLPAPPHTLEAAANDGTTALAFRVSSQLVALGADARLVGGGIPSGGTGAGPLLNNPPLPFGATTCRITYRAVIQDLFSDVFPSGDQSIDQGDILANTALVDGAVLRVSDLTPTGSREADDTAEALEIGRGDLSKTIYAINGDTSCPPGNCSGGAATVIKPGDTVTYRLRLTLPSSDVEQLRLADYLPLPIFDVNDNAAPVVSRITSFNPTVSAAPPPAGAAKFGPSDNFTAESGIVPTISLDSVANSVTFNYGSYDDPNNTPNTIDLLFTVTTSFDPFADKLLLTNQLRELETSTNAGDQVIDRIVQLTINEPELRMRKGVVATNATSFTPSPLSLPAGVTVNPAAPCASRISGAVTSANLAATFDSNVSGVDAGDEVTFAIVVENVGSGPDGAFDVRVRDVLPAGLSFVAGSLCVSRGADGAEMPFTTIGGGLFDPAGGIELTDPSATQGALGPGESRLTTAPINNGNNIAIVTFNATVAGSVGLNQALVNQGRVYHYANTNGGLDFTKVDLSDPATVTSGLPVQAKYIVSTSEAHTSGARVAIGEIVRYRLAARIPEGTLGAVTLRDLLPPGLSYLDDGTARVVFVSNGGITSSTLGAVPNLTRSGADLAALLSTDITFLLPDTAVSSSATAENDTYLTGADPYFKLGDIVNADNDSNSEFIVVEFNALVDNTIAGSNDGGETRPNSFQFYVDTAQVGANASNVTATIGEPILTTNKSVTPASGDAGDTVTYTVVLANTGGTGSAATNRTTAFNVVMSDPLPASLENVTIVSTTTGGAGSVVNPSSSLSGNTLTVTADSIASGATLTVVYSARLPATVTPGQAISNTATTTYTSLPGANGTSGNPTGSNNTGAPGADTGERTGSGAAPNDHASSGVATVTVFVPAPDKSIVATSEAHTSGSSAAVGEIVRYRLVVRIAEGSSPAAELRDNLPAGMRFLNDGTARVALASSDPGLSSSTLSGAGLQLWPFAEGNINGVTPTFVLPSGAISGGTGAGGAFQSGDDPVFALGNLTNTDSDSNQEFVVLEFNALVENVVGNQGDTVLNNSFTARFGGSDSATSSDVPVTVTEPDVLVNKAAVIADGATVTYEVIVGNAGPTTAFDLVVGDVLPAALNLDVSSVTITASAGATTGVANHSDGANRVEFTGITLPAGAGVTITYRAAVLTPGATIDNTATAAYTSLPGANGTTSNPTGSSNSGSPGDADGERTGSNSGPNDYLSSDGATLGSLGDRVWFDVDGNGVQNAGEPGIPGVEVTVRWFGPDGVEGVGADSVIVTTTAADGSYLVSGLPIGGGANNYRVTVNPATLPNGLTAATYDLDSGTASPNGDSLIALTAGSPNPRTLDFGYRGTASLGDRVWLDSDGNGNQGPAALEPGLPGVGVSLTWLGFNGVAGGGDDVSYTATTNNLGAYGFANLPAGNFTVAVDDASLPTNVSQTYDLNGGLDNAATRTLASAEAAADVDFGYRGAASVGDTVWYDVDGDGAQNNAEPGIPGATVVLRWAGPDGALGTGDDVFYTTTTDGSGRYSFPGLPVFDADDPYRVTVTPPAGYTAQTFDSDGTGTANQSELNLSANSSNTAQDFGYRAAATQGLGDRVWEDLNGNGRQDGGEPPIAGATVQLYDGAGANLLAVTTTDAGGAYSFPGLQAGSYQVRFATPASYAATAADSPVATEATDSDAGASGFSGPATVTAGAFNNTVDAGFYRPLTVGDYIWHDVDGDAAQEAGEPPIAGLTVTVTWHGPDGAPAGGDDQEFSATTDPSGFWTIASLPPGSYGAAVTGLPADLTTRTAGSSSFTLVSGVSRDDIDFGYRGAGSIGDFVWLDINGDGAQAGEEGIGGATVTLTWYGPDGAPGGGDDITFTTTTGADGAYSFGGLRAGSFEVAVSGLPAGVSPTYDLDGTASASSAQTSLTPGQSRDDVDFGYQGTGSLGDLIWLDTDGDGVLGTGEEGIAGVDVALTWAGLDNSFSTGDDIALTTVTAPDGAYGFANLPAGQFHVTVSPASLPGGVAQTYDLDSLVTPNQASGGLLAAEDRDDFDFGYRGAGSIGDRVWFDADGDGSQDAGEPGIAGVTVELTWAGPDGNLGTADDIGFVTSTAADGAYSFSGLPAGSYSVDVDRTTAPAGTTLTTANDPQAVTLAAGESFADADFGFTGVGSLGDRVWLDRNGNGAQEGGEPGIADVAVTLVWAGPDGDFATLADNVTYTTTTDDAGLYSFDRLAAGQQRVTVTPASLPGGLAQTYDLDGFGTAGQATGSLTAGQSRDDFDFGYQGAGSLGDRVWFDANGDGAQSPGEPGVPGVDVTLTWHGPDGAPGGGDDATFALTTGADGAYSFGGLPAGSYSVDVDQADAPAGTSLTTANDPQAVALGVGQHHTDADFGFTGTGSLGDRLWLDLDGDGVQEAGEPGLVGIGLTLTWHGPDGAPGTGDDVSYTTASGADGGYSFGGLPAGAFDLAVDAADLPAGLAATFDLDGTATPSATAVILAAGEQRDDADFGYQGSGSIGDRIWLDFDGDGAQDAGEPGLGNIAVALTWHGPDGVAGGGDDGTLTTASDADGAFDFSGLPAGSYSVDVAQADAPAGTSLTTANDPQAVALAAGQDYNDADFGFTGAGSIGDRIWNDLDGDGVQDAGEPGIAGVTLTISWAGPDGTAGTSDDVLYTAVTGANGTYLVDNLPAGSFQVAADTATLPAGLNPTFDADGLATPSLATVQLSPSQDRLEVDFGYSNAAPTATAALGDRVWLDTNGDGAQDTGEPGIAGVGVTLVSAGPDGIFGTPDDFAGFTPQLTDADGNYQFTALPAGLYRVAVDGATLPPSIAGSYELDGTLNGATEVGLAAGQTRSDVDFGYTNVNAGAPSGSIGDRVWNDLDGDGVQDAGEPGIPGITVGLLWFDHSGAPQIAETVTDADGAYSFDNLGTGLYIVVVDDTTLAPGLTPSYDLDGAFDGLTMLLLGLGEDRTDVDFGYSAAPISQGSGSIGDRVWNDLNGDGAQDAGEPGLPLVAVTLTWHGADGLPGGDDMVFYTVTDDNGEYSFPGLPAGSFSVAIDPATLPAGLSQTYELDGTRDGATTVTLASGEARDDVDFGYQGAGSIGDRIWHDLNGDGVQDTGEPGIAGVRVNLLSVVSLGSLSGTSVPILTAVTASDGSYSFAGLPAGDYIVEIDPATSPATFSETFELDGSMDESAAVSLAPGQQRVDVDFGYTDVPLGAPSSIGDFVWLDIDGDGVQDTDEPGIAGARVNLIGAGADNLFGTGDDLTFTQLTAPDGLYEFSGLQPGDYQVIVDAGSLPGGLIQTYDLDATLDHATQVKLGAGESRTDVDFGYQGTGSIGDRIWNDLNGDGVQDAGEPGIAGARVTLGWAGPDGVLNTADDADFEALTDSDGSYSFDGLPAGSYRVAVDPATIAPDLLPTYELDGALDGLADVGLGVGQDRDDVDFGYVVPAMDLAIAKSDAGATATAGGALVYTLAYTNTGNYAATGVTITETVPQHTRFSSAGSSPGWSCADGAAAGTVCTYTVGALARTASGTVAFAVMVDAALPAGADELSNTASVADDGTYGPDLTPADNSAVELTPLDAAPDLRLEKALADGQASVDPGDLAVYSLRYRNSGAQDATGVTVTETVPQHTSFSSAGSSSGWSCADGAAAGTTCTYTVGALAAGAEGEVSFAVRVNALIPAGVTAIVNSAGIADDGTNGADPTPPNNSDGATSPFGFTAVTLLSFTATRADDGVLVRWVTGAELETWGFELYRSATGERADAVRVTPTAILARGGASGGAEYSWRDTTAAAGTSYTYWLVERELDGTTHEYGPARVTATTAAGAYSVHLPLIRR